MTGQMNEFCHRIRCGKNQRKLIATTCTITFLFAEIIRKAILTRYYISELPTEALPGSYCDKEFNTRLILPYFKKKDAHNDVFCPLNCKENETCKNGCFLSKKEVQSITNRTSSSTLKLQHVAICIVSGCVTDELKYNPASVT